VVGNTLPSAEDRLTISQRSVGEGFLGYRRQDESRRGGRNPARVTVTSRRTAALDGRLLAAVRAWRQSAGTSSTTSCLS